jgi:hypothetical protein
MAELKPFVVKFDGKEVTQTLRQIGQEISLAKKEQDKFAVGTKEWVEATKKLETVRDRYKEVKEEGEKAADSLRSLDLSKFGAVGGVLQNVKNQLSDLKGGFGSVIQSFGLLKTAIAATGIGLLLLAFTALVAYFQKTDDGAKKLDGIMRGIGATIDILTNLLFKAGEALIKTFSNPKQALMDLGNFLVNNIINRFKAFAVILDGIINLDFKKVADGTIQLGTGVTDATSKMDGLVESTKKLGTEIGNAVKEGMDLAEMLDAIDDQRRETELASAQNEKLINRLLLQSKNRTTSDAERIALLDRAGKLETQNHLMQLDLNAQNIKAIELELAQKIKAANSEVDLRKKTNAQLIALAKDDQLGKGTLSDEDLDKYNEILIAKEQLDTKSIEVQEKINNRRDALEARAAQKREKAAEKQKAAEEKQRQELQTIQDAQLAAFQKTQDIEVQLIENETAKKEAALRLQATREIEAANKSKATTELKAGLVIAIENKLAADLKKIQVDSAKAQKDNADKAAKEDLDLRRTQAQARADLEVSIAQAQAAYANKSGNFQMQMAADEALMNAQIANIETKATFELESLNLTETQKQLIISNSENQIAQIREQAAQADRQRSAQSVTQMISGFSNAFSAIADFGKISSDKEISRIEKDKAKRIKSLDDEFKKGKVSKEAYETSKAEIEQGFDEKTNAIKNQQAQDQKKYNIAQAIMQGAIAFISASANPLGSLSPTAIATGIMAAINVAKVIATPIPEFAKGGVLNGPSHAQGGMKIVSGGRAVAEIEGGEPILSRATYRNNPDLVNLLLDSSMNRGGSKVYVDSGLLNSYRFETGGILPGADALAGSRNREGKYSDGSEMVVAELRMLRQEIAASHRETINTIQNVDTLLKSYVVVSDVGDALNELRSIKREASAVLNDGTTREGSPVTLNNNLF